MEQNPRRIRCMADEDRAYTARMLGGCLKIGCALMLLGAGLAIWGWLS